MLDREGNQGKTRLDERPSFALYRNSFSVTPGNLHDGAGIVLLPLVFSTGQRLDPTILSGTQAPQQVNRVVIIRRIEARGHHEHIDIAPRIDFAGEL